MIGGTISLIIPKLEKYGRGPCEPSLTSYYAHVLFDLKDASDDLRTKAKRALKNVLQKCVHLPALEPLLEYAPPEILKHVVGQFSKANHSLVSIKYFSPTR